MAKLLVLISIPDRQILAASLIANKCSDSNLKSKARY